MKEQQTIIIGLTGQTGAGKSTVSRLFSGHGAAVVDADAVARDTIEGSTECLADLVLEFSTEIITPDATLNRKKLASICFSDKKKLSRLNAITYPHIIRAIEEKIQEHLDDAPMLILDAPTLYEAGLDERCHRVVAVLADEQVRAGRIMERDNMTEDEAYTRINAQKRDSFYLDRADYILRNNDDLDALRQSFLELCEELEQIDPRVPRPEKMPKEEGESVEEEPLTDDGSETPQEETVETGSFGLEEQHVE